MIHAKMSLMTAKWFSRYLGNIKHCVYSFYDNALPLDFGMHDTVGYIHSFLFKIIAHISYKYYLIVS